MGQFQRIWTLQQESEINNPQMYKNTRVSVDYYEN